MKKVIGVLSALLVGTFLTHFSNGTEPVRVENASPAFHVALSTAIRGLEGVTSVTTTGARPAEAKGEASQGPTFDPLTCDNQDPRCRGFTSNQLCWITFDHSATCVPPGGLTCDIGITCKSWYSCDSRLTCDGSLTCDGCFTCWNSTCNEPKSTCDGTDTCNEGIFCNFTLDGSFTCNGIAECVPNTVNGWPTCAQVGNPACTPSATNKTTWGDLKARFK